MMEHVIEIADSFQVAGIAVRTTNANRQSAQDISALWQRFLRDNIIGQIPHKESNAVYCVYTDYESDQNAAYTTVLGCKVTSLQHLPDHLVGIIIPAATYQVFTSSGKLPESIQALWQQVRQASINRRYSADFDVYDDRLQDPANKEVKTYVSVNEA